MSKTKGKKTKLIYGLLIIFCVALLVSSGLLLLSYWERGQGLFTGGSDNSLDSVITVDGTDYSFNEDIETVLVMGLDKFEDAVDNTGYNNDQRADFLMLFVIDNVKETYSAIFLNRDTMAEINILGVAGEKVDTVTQQLALAHTYGNGDEVSCRNTVDAVSGILNGIKIDRYVSVTMDAVPVITDHVGGVEVEVTDDFSGIDDSLVMGEKVVLNGEQALAYVRGRQGLEDSSNEARMNRQKGYISSLFTAFNEKAKQDNNFVINASLELSEFLVSNYTINQLENLVINLSSYTFESIYNIDGNTTINNNLIEFYVDEKYVDELVLDVFYVPEK